MQWAKPPATPLFSSFLGVFDIKLGVTIISLLALLNKVAGVYGVLAVFTGGSLAQVTMYIYSIITIGLVLYGLKGTGEENSQTVMMYAHCFFADHVVSTLYTVVFGVAWYVFDPHDGRRVANSEAQQDMMNHPGAITLSPLEREEAARAIWREERGFATVVLAATWLVKIYFIAIVYSFALHLRRGSYASLPLSKPPSAIATSGNRRRNSYAYSHLRDMSSSTVFGDEASSQATGH